MHQKQFYDFPTVSLLSYLQSIFFLGKKSSQHSKQKFMKLKIEDVVHRSQEKNNLEIEQLNRLQFFRRLFARGLISVCIGVF